MLSSPPPAPDSGQHLPRVPRQPFLSAKTRASYFLLVFILSLPPDIRISPLLGNPDPQPITALGNLSPWTVTMASVSSYPFLIEKSISHSSQKTP